jgi:hypothetical protein
MDQYQSVMLTDIATTSNKGPLSKQTNYSSTINSPPNMMQNSPQNIHGYFN